jgi:uncharacterized protein YjbI with pentapeptide repeats
MENPDEEQEALLRRVFEGYGLAANDISGLKTPQIQALAAAAKPFTNEQLIEAVALHHLFLAMGGAGGKWRVAAIEGWTVGVYSIAPPKEGQQLHFEGKNLRLLDLRDLRLPFANFCGCCATGTAFAKGDFSYSLFADALLDTADFQQAKLCGCDFSRASLRGANFGGADLSGTDFEHCDLTGACFTRAKLLGSNFAGAILEQICY